jgi:IS5 family transposase
MRKIFQSILSIFWSSSDEEAPLQVVADYRDSYQRIDELLDSMPDLLEFVHSDLMRLSQNPKGGRQSDFTSEILFRAILVMQREGLTFRETTLRIAESETLQKFCRLWKKSSIDHTLLCRAFNAIQPETWEMINKLLGIQMKSEERINVDEIRTDTTVTESNIHYPTDSSLLWDTYRVLERYIEKLRQLGVAFPQIHFHLDKIKKLHLDITRFSRSKNKQRQRWIRKLYQKLINRVRKMLRTVQHAIHGLLKTSDHPVIQHIATSLQKYFPTMTQIISVAQRRFDGEKVPVTEKVFSLFEPHTELIKRGRRNKPVEFGHKVLLSETKEKFITDFQVFEKSPADNTLLPVVIERHENIFGRKMKTLSADMGFRPNKKEFEKLEQELKYIAVPKCLSSLGDNLLAEYQKFRAGIEGTISCLKRAYRLSRCCFRGFKGFCRAVGSAVFCHNLVVMTAKPKEIKQE